MIGDSVVVDAEPLVAYYWDEPGSDRVDGVISAIESGQMEGAVSTVTCTEVQYVCARDDPQRATEYVDRIRTWFRVVDAETVWRRAAAFKREHTLALGDAFTLATAAHRDAVALVGADDDYDAVDTAGVTIERFREESA